MKKFTVGQNVRFINAAAHIKSPAFYPEVGTIGKVVCVNDFDCLVAWPDGTTSGSGRWYAENNDLVAVRETKQPSTNAALDEFSPEVSRALKDLFSYVERVNVSRQRALYVDYNRSIPGLLSIMEWDKEKRTFSVHENFHSTRYGGNIVRMIEAAHIWLTINHPANDRCGTHVYYARLSFRCPDVACLVRTTTRSALVAAKEIGEGAEIVEIQSLHGRVLDIAKKQPDGTYKRLK